MAKSYQLRILEQGVDAWNEWRAAHPDIFPDLSRAYLNKLDLSNANLSHTNLQFAFLNYSTLDDADLSHASLNEAQLKGASIKGADLYCASFKRAQLQHASFNRANLKHAKITEALCFYTDFSNIDADSASLDLGTFDYAMMVNADVRNASLCHASFRNADLSESRFDNSDLSHAVISNTSLQETSFHRVRLIETKLENLKPIRTVLEGAELSDTVISNVDFSETLGLSDCIHRGPSFVDEQTLDNTPNLPEKFLKGTELPAGRILDYVYRFSVTVGFAKKEWVQMIPLNAILEPVVEGKFLAEQGANKVVVRLRSAIQIEGVLDAIVPVLTALHTIDPSAISVMEIQYENGAPCILPSEVLHHALYEVESFLTLPPSNGSKDILPGQIELHPAILADHHLKRWFAAYQPSSPLAINPHSRTLYNHFVEIFDRLFALLSITPSRTPSSF